MNELNPNHPVTRQLHDQWHKFCALLLWKQGLTSLDITLADVERFAAAHIAAVTIREVDAVITLTLVNEAEALRLARQEGGLPV